MVLRMKEGTVFLSGQSEGFVVSAALKSGSMRILNHSS